MLHRLMHLVDPALDIRGIPPILPKSTVNSLNKLALVLRTISVEPLLVSCFHLMSRREGWISPMSLMSFKSDWPLLVNNTFIGSDVPLVLVKKEKDG
jgi:hypothetical protein